MTTAPMIDYDAEKFLRLMSKKSFSYIGVAMLIRAHLLITETHRLKSIDIDHILHIRNANTRNLIDQVIAGSFKTDSEGYIYSTAVDRTMGRRAIPESSPD